MIKKIICCFCLFISAATHSSEKIETKTLNVILDKASMVSLPVNAKSVFIASSNVADYQTLTNTKLMVFGKQTGATSLYVLDVNENVIYSATVKVSHNVAELNSLIKREFPDALVTAESTAGKLFLKGQVPTPAMAEKIVRLAEGYVSKTGNASKQTSKEDDSGSDNKEKQDSEASAGKLNKDELINQLLVTMPTQVNLRVRIAEVSRNVSNKLGIKWGSYGNGTGRFSFIDNAGSIGLPSSWANLSVIVDALAANGMMSVLAEPNLTAQSGEKASFLVGGEVALPLILNDSASVVFKPFGVRLDFKPTVLSSNRISLQVEPEVSTIANDTNVSVSDSSFPTFMTRKASTTVELASGQSFALGGLLQSKEIELLQKMPLIGDVPILGALFRSTEFKREETELIIIATVYLVEPTRSDSLPLPTDGLIPMSDVERLLAWPRRNGKRDGGVSNRTDNRQPRLLGDNGFYY